MDAPPDHIVPGERLRAPWAASVAGIAFAILFTVSLVLLRTQPIFAMTDAEVAAWFESGQDFLVLVGALYMAPFAGIAFLWFIAVIRDQLGEREDKFFGTVFLGSGLLFVAMYFVAVAVVEADGTLGCRGERIRRRLLHLRSAKPEF